MALLVFKLFSQFLLSKFFFESSATYYSLNNLVGVLEANFIEPAHDKQDFERSSLYIRLEARLKQMVMDYWFVTVYSLLAVCKSWNLLGENACVCNYFLLFFSRGRGRVFLKSFAEIFWQCWKWLILCLNIEILACKLQNLLCLILILWIIFRKSYLMTRGHLFIYPFHFTLPCWLCWICTLTDQKSST